MLNLLFNLWFTAYRFIFNIFWTTSYSIIISFNLNNIGYILYFDNNSYPEKFIDEHITVCCVHGLERVHQIMVQVHFHGHTISYQGLIKSSIFIDLQCQNHKCYELNDGIAVIISLSIQFSQFECKIFQKVFWMCTFQARTLKTYNQTSYYHASGVKSIKAK